MTDLATLTRIVSELAAKVEALSARIPVRVGAQPSPVIIDVSQAAHGFDVGQAVTFADVNTWISFTDAGSNSYIPSRPLWGIVVGVTGANSYRVAIAGEAKTTSTTLVPGYLYTFQDGDPVQINTEYPPFEAAGAGVCAMAISTTSIVIANDGRFQDLRSQDGTYVTVAHESISAGHYVVWAGAPSGESPLALADPDNPWKWTNVGIALFEVGAAGTWLVLTSGSHFWSSINNGDTRPTWMKTLPWNIGQRICLSETNPGQYATAEPAFKVYAGISMSDYAAADPPTPEATTFSAYAVSQGVPYPIPASGGGTGTDVSALDEHSVLFMDTYGSPSSRKIAGLLSATPDYAVIAQKDSEPPTHLSLDLDASGTFKVDAGVLYGAAGGKRFAAEEPTTDNQFLKFDGTEWVPFFLLDTENAIPSWNGTAYTQIAPEDTASLLVYNSTALEWLNADANGKILQRAGDELEFSNDPTLTRSGTDFKFCTVNTITATTTAPSASGVKGQMHFIF